MTAEGRAREQQLIGLLRQEGYIAIQDLVVRLGLSRSTVRRTLGGLAERGLVRLVHGGAMATEASGNEGAKTPATAVTMLAEKQRIAAAAAGFIRDGDMVFIDTGSTTYELVPHLKAKQGLTVLTNDLHIAHELVGCPGVTVVVTGGTLGMGNPYSLVGRAAEQTVGLFVANRCIIGASGIDAVHGITDPYPEVAQVKAAMMRQAAEVMLIADHTKLGRMHKALVAPVQGAHRIITDAGATPQEAERLRAAGVAVLLC
jgi:DeoR/GlpR family transcriptional regulator of sugar metabolism